jgi:YgiT-type zinc finger domain-containing protein
MYTLCEIGEMQDGLVTVTLQRDENIIVVKKVPALVCENCGEYVLNDVVISRLMNIAEGAISHQAEIEVLQYAA